PARAGLRGEGRHDRLPRRGRAGDRAARIHRRITRALPTHRADVAPALDGHRLPPDATGALRVPGGEPQSDVPWPRATEWRAADRGADAAVDGAARQDVTRSYDASIDVRSLGGPIHAPIPRARCARVPDDRAAGRRKERGQEASAQHADEGGDPEGLAAAL